MSLALLILALSCLPGVAYAQPGPARPQAARAPVFLQSCTITPFASAPLFAVKAPATTKAAKNRDADADDDDDAASDDDDDDSVRGVTVPGSGTCLALSGTVSAGMQYDAYRAPELGRSAPSNGSSSQASASFTITSSHDLASGLRIGTVLGFTFYNPADDGGAAVLDQATVSLGPWVFGLDASRFSFWTGDDFVMTARVPARTVGLIGLELPLTDSWTAGLSLEDTQLGVGSPMPDQGGRRVPDGIVRLVYASGPWTVHGATALRDVPGRPYRFGRAGILGVTYEAEILGGKSNVSGQIVGAIDGAPYIGGTLDARLIRGVLLGTETTRGFSTVLSTRREWTQTIATNAYVSRYRLSLALQDSVRGKVGIDRATANIVWTPVEGFKAGVETSVAWARIALVGRATPANLAGRQITTQVFVERSF